MSRFICNLRLLHKLALPGLLMLAAAVATLATAFHWMRFSRTKAA